MNLKRLEQLLMRHRLMNEAGEGDAGGGAGTGDEGASGDPGGEGSDGDSNDGGKAGDEGKGGEAKAKPGKPSDAEAKLLKDVMKQKTRARELEAQLAEVQNQLKNYEGLDPKTARDLIARQKDEEQKQLEKKGEWDRLKAQMVEQHSRDMQAVRDEAAAVMAKNSALAGQIADLTVGNACGTSKFVQEDLTLTPGKARVIYGSHFEFADGKVVAYDKPAGAAERTMLVDGAGEPLRFDDAMRKIIEADTDRDRLLKSKVKPGAGSNTTGKGKPADLPTKDLSSIDKIRVGLATLAKQKPGG